MKITDRQGCDEGGQGRTNQAGFAQQQVARAPRHRRQHADTGTGGGTAGALERMIAVPYAGDPDAVRSRSSTKWALWPLWRSHISNGVAHAAQSVG
jgi:hypothetical protein